MNNKELKEIFGKRAIQTTCNEKMAELFEEIKKLNTELNSWKQGYANTSEYLKWYYWAKVELVKYIIQTKDEAYNYWERLKAQVSDKKVSTNYQQIDVNEVKQRVTFEDILGKPDWKDAKRARYKCPLHNEKTASFTVYLDQNTCHCYGCGFNSDVVGFYQALHNCDFRTALKELSK